MSKVWKNIGSLFGAKRTAMRRENARVEAYVRLFTGKGTPADADVVLVDLAKESRFFMVTGDEMDNNSVRMQEGMRALFLRIYNTLNMDHSERDQLATLARIELMQDDQLEEEQTNVS